MPVSRLSGGCDGGACLVGVEEPAAEPAVLVEVTIGDLDARRVADAVGLDRVEPGGGDQPFGRRGGLNVVGGVNSTARRGARMAASASEPAPSEPNAFT